MPSVVKGFSVPFATSFSHKFQSRRNTEYFPSGENTSFLSRRLVSGSAREAFSNNSFREGATSLLPSTGLNILYSALFAVKALYHNLPSGNHCGRILLSTSLLVLPESMLVARW